jgi:hypothetical protein
MFKVRVRVVAVFACGSFSIVVGAGDCVQTAGSRMCRSAVHVLACCVLQVGEPRPLPFLMKVLRDVGRGLQSVRASRVLHMDLKAANVVLDWDGPDSRYALHHMELKPCHCVCMFVM